jgi:hypothetical protein
MAKQIITTLIDDLDGSPADETVEFALDGARYEVDLRAANAKKMRDALYPFVAAAFRLSPQTGARVQRREPPPAPVVKAQATSVSVTDIDPEQKRAIRAWAARKGKGIANRGRLPQWIIDEYNDAGGL